MDIKDRSPQRKLEHELQKQPEAPRWPDPNSNHKNENDFDHTLGTWKIMTLCQNNPRSIARFVSLNQKHEAPTPER